MTPDRVQEIARHPLMIVGAPRSGTTWLQQLLLSDPRCCGGQESHFFVSFGRVLVDFDQKSALKRRHGLAAYWKREDFLTEIRDLWLKTVTSCLKDKPDATLLVEKTPDHACWMERIVEVLPDARFIHVIRDSRAVCASLLAAGRAPWGQGWAPTRLQDAVDTWTRHVKAAERSGRQLASDRYLRVHYEDVHAHPLRELDHVWTFAGITVDRDELSSIVEGNELSQRRKSPDPGFYVGGDLANEPYSEPEGFLGSGKSNSWMNELGWLQRRRIWRQTSQLLKQLGYDRTGRVSN
ncbi:MAG: sulfotransferase family protein [Planctomycetota bacterium]